MAVGKGRNDCFKRPSPTHTQALSLARTQNLNPARTQAQSPAYTKTLSPAHTAPLSAPTQDRWKAVRSGDAAAVSTDDSGLLLRVIANSAARFPPAEAASLAADLLKARRPLTTCTRFLYWRPAICSDASRNLGFFECRFLLTDRVLTELRGRWPQWRAESITSYFGGTRTMHITQHPKP